MNFSWRGHVTTAELNALHAEAFEGAVRNDEEWPWTTHLIAHSLGWVTAREDAYLRGFANVLWDGFTHAWVQDVMVAVSARHRGVGRQLIRQVEEHSRSAGCEWLHVDFRPELASFYIAACGFTPTHAGLIKLQPAREAGRQNCEQPSRSVNSLGDGGDPGEQVRHGHTGQGCPFRARLRPAEWCMSRT